MAVTLHTSLGDIKLELYCDLVPRTCEVRCAQVSINGGQSLYNVDIPSAMYVGMHT